jgi:hypothetical protein
MKIIVEYCSELLGAGIFWQGDAANIMAIRNIPARRCARKVAKDGVARKVGMWTVRAEPNK